MVFILLLPFVLISYCQCFTRSHILREKVNPNIFSKHNNNGRVSYLSRAHKQASHTVIFAIAQLNMDKLTAVLDDVSNPSSQNYGKHWSKEKVAEFTANEKGYEATMQYIQSREGITIVQKTLYNEYIFATATVEVWEEVFATVFHVYEVRDKKAATTVIRAEEYSLPIELDSHVFAVFNTVQFPPENLLQSSGHRDVLSDTKSNVADESTGSSNGIIYGYVTPAFINQYYNVSNNNISSKATQAVFETDNQSYSPSDLLKFQQYFHLVQHPVSEVIGGHAFNNSCVYHNGNNCEEANLDVQYIMGIAESVATIYYYSNTSETFLSWIITVANTPTPANVYSISYCGYEAYFSPSYTASFDNEAIKLGVMGTTILASSGDDGVAGFDARPNIYGSGACGYNPQFPASSPYVTSVGGTIGPQLGKPEVVCQSGLEGALITSGGGFSNFYSLPSWQSSFVNGYLSNVDGTSEQPYTTTKYVTIYNKYYGGDITVNIGTFNSTGRGYPDVSLLAHNYQIMVNGKIVYVDGTSASSPTMAAFVSLVNAERLNRGMSTMGWINPFLYQYSSEFVFDITSGYNKCSAMYDNTHTCCKEGFNATKGWDPVTGLGSINYEKFLSAALSVGTTSSSSSSSSSSLSVGAIAGIAVGGAFLIVLAAAVLYYVFYIRTSRKPVKSDVAQANESTPNPMSSGVIV